MSIMLCSVFLIVMNITTVHERKTLPLLTIVRAATGRVQKLLVKCPYQKTEGGKGSIFLGNTTFNINRESKINLSPVSSNKITPT